jgi:uncharacterized protein YndB with AHSA1/START domain
MAEAELAHFIDRWTVEYIRIYAHPIHRVWRAITDPAELSKWFIPTTKWELATGGSYRFHNDGFSGTILQVEPPRFIKFSNANDAVGYFQYELSEVDGGTRMHFVQHFDPKGAYSETPDDLGGDLPGGPDTPWKPGFVGGFHEFWDALGDHLDGVPIGSRLPATEMNAVVKAWAKHEQDLSTQVRDGIVNGLRRQERWNELNKIYRAHIKATLPVR